MKDRAKEKDKGKAKAKAKEKSKDKDKNEVKNKAKTKTQIHVRVDLTTRWKICQNTMKKITSCISYANSDQTSILSLVS